ncbi:hypothetical protein F441_04606 [Phytophthora nicotianae CJ01A1]|uniref:Uncharacterized protein n=2 Tax=Phytophthora nicotianae TaxID=4792 RepID=W2LML8_PHYNI|nr:hypothetical protein L917_04346 [Phytophthora nicotianae]ETM51784.1 hypothetical protein L914_04447 [Phytophthora nicotianae]ETP21991.1 hypothetical protein F441_04606 [Phytophthora nicotianae CJ01A1]
MAKKRSATAKPERIADSDLSRLDTPWCRGTSWPQPAGVHARRADTSPVEFGADARAGISWRWSEVSLQSSVFCSAALALSNNYVHVAVSLPNIVAPQLRGSARSGAPPEVPRDLRADAVAALALLLQGTRWGSACSHCES